MKRKGLLALLGLLALALAAAPALADGIATMTQGHSFSIAFGQLFGEQIDPTSVSQYAFVQG